jgi:hypothetical protein
MLRAWCAGYYEAMLEILRVSEQSGGLPTIAPRRVGAEALQAPTDRVSTWGAPWSRESGALPCSQTGGGLVDEAQSSKAEVPEVGDVVALNMTGTGIVPRLNASLARKRVFRGANGPSERRGKSK